MSRIAARILSGMLLLVTLSPARAQAQSFAAGVSLGSGSMGVGQESESTLVGGVTGRLGFGARDRFALGAEFVPVGVRSPIADESFRAVNLLVGLELGSTLRFRPGLGVQFRSWSGRERVEDSDAGLLLALDMGPRLQLNDSLWLSPELTVRYSQIEIEGDVRGRSIGVQCVLGWKRKVTR